MLQPHDFMIYVLSKFRYLYFLLPCPLMNRTHQYCITTLLHHALPPSLYHIYLPRIQLLTQTLHL